MEELTVSKFNIKYICNSQYESELLHLIAQNPDQAVDSYSTILKHDLTTTVAMLSRDGVKWIIKRYNTKNPWHALRRPFRRSRAANCWQMSKLFAESGISLPAPVACIENRFGPLRGKSYYINKYTQGENLLTYLTACGQQPDVVEVKERVIELFEILRAARLVHGDMKATNILVSDGKLILLDLDAAKKTDTQTSLQRGYKKDRRRFLKNWECHPELHALFKAGLPDIEA